jgi:hypothetical protein
VSAPLYVREGSRFVPLPEVLLRDVPPIPVPQQLDEPGGDRADPGNPQRTVLAVERCPHGSFARWASRNCCARR